MEIEEIEKYILDIPRFTKKNSMEDTEFFLQRLGNPEKTSKIIHIAGTNGKGSVCAYLSSMLQKMGYRVGMFTSPHLITMRERFQINHKMISEEQFKETFTLVKEKVEKLGEEEKTKYFPTFFEFLFFMGMLWFEKEKTDYIILETGLGGRLDATNSVKEKAACVITEIGYDHMQYLGNTLSEIASEKAGILRKGTPVIFMAGKTDVERVIEAKAKELFSPSFPVSKKDVRNIENHKNSIDFSYKSRYYGYVRVHLQTGALYQTENAALAIRTLEYLFPKEKLDLPKILQGLRETSWEGRMEEILPDVFLDGAHNTDGILAFLDTVRADGCRKKRLLLFSAVADKQYEKMIELLVKSQLFSGILVTQLESERRTSITQLKNVFAAFEGHDIIYYETAEEAFEALLKNKEVCDTAYIAGSLYLAGQIKGLLGRNDHDKF